MAVLVRDARGDGRNLSVRPQAVGMCGRGRTPREAPLEMQHCQRPVPYASEHKPLAFSLPKTYCSCSELLHSEICQGSNMNH